MIPADMVGGEPEHLRARVRELEAQLVEREARIEELTRSEAGFRRVVDSARDVISRFRPDGTVAYVSPNVRELLGLGAEDVLDTRLVDHAHPDDVPQVSQVFAAAVTGEVGRVTARVFRADGGVRHLEIAARPVFGADGSVVEVISVARDVTERVANERALTEANRVMAEVQRMTLVGSWSMDLTDGTIQWSAGMHRIFGLDPETFVPSVESYLTFVHPDEREWVAASIASRTGDDAEGFATEHRAIRADGVEIVVRTSGRTESDPDGGVVRLIGFVQDVTETRRIEAELAAAHAEAADQNRLMHEAQQIAGVGSWSFDLATGAVEWSDQMRRIFLGTAEGDVPVTPASYQEYVLDEDRARVQEEFARAVAEVTPYALEHRIRRPDGQIRIINAMGRVEVGPDGVPVSVTGTGEDVTEAHETARQLTEAKSLLDQLVRAPIEQAMILIGDDQRIVLWNAGAEKLLGWTAEEMLGVRGLSRIHVPGEWEYRESEQDDDDENLVRRGPSGDHDADPHEWTFVRKDGTTLRVHLSVRRTRDARGNRTGRIGIATDVTDRRRIEQELAAAHADAAHKNRLMEEAQRISAIGSWSLDLVSGDVEWSAQMTRMLGADPDVTSLDAESYLSLLLPEDRAETEAEIGRSLADLVPYSVLHRVRLPDGQIRLMHAQGRIESDGAGTPRRMTGTLEDVTERRAAERELLDARDRMAEAQRITGIGSWSWDMVTDGLTWSEEMVRVFGLETGPADYPAYLAVIHPDDRERFDQTVQESVRTVSSFDIEHRYLHASGEVRILRALGRVETDHRGAPIRLSGTGEDVTERRAAERELTEARDLMTEAQRISGIGSWIFDLVEGTVTSSDQQERLMGFASGEGPSDLGEYMLLVHPDDRDAAETVFRETMAGGHPKGEQEYRLIRNDGEARLYAVRWRVDRDPDGQPIRLTGTTEDVTERRQIERDLLEAQELFRQLLRAATGQAIVATDMSGAVTIFNKGAEQMLGWSAEEMLGRSWTSYHVPEDVRVWRENRRRGVVPGVPGSAATDDTPDVRECALLRQDGTQLQAQLSVTRMYDPDGVPTGFLGIATDVTRQREIERERDEHAAMLRAIIDHDQSLIYVRDLEDRYLLINKAFEKMAGIPEALLVGSTGAGRSAEADEMWAEHRQLALQGAYESLDVVPLADGPHYYEAVKLPLRDAQGFVYAILGISHDVTEIRRGEEDSRRAVEVMGEARDRALEANAAKSSFLATMSHEIRTPMNAVIGLTGLLIDSDLDDEQRDLLQTVRSSGDQLLAIINDILDFSKVEAGELDLEHRPFDLRELLARTVAQTAAISSGLELGGVVEPDVPEYVVGDQTRLRQVLSNLLGNAVKFTSEGSVQVRASVKPAQRGEEEGLVLRFDVTDTGIGIPAEAMHRLFRSFSQVDASTTRVYGGTGLGLAISRGLTEAMGGTMWVESEVGVGSTFSFTVQVGIHVPEPVESAEPEARAAVPGPRAGERPAGGRHVLLAEDNPVNQKVGRLMLDRLGHTVEVAAHGLAALEAVRDRDFDVVLMDMHMPEMDGLESTRRIRAELPEGRQPYIIALTASVTQEDRDACAAAGMNAYVAKPVRLEDLAAAFDVATAVLGDRRAVPGPTP